MIRTTSVHTKTWYLFAEGLKYLYKRRKALSKRKTTSFEIASINSSILIHLSVTLEGAVNSLLYTKLECSPEYEKAKWDHNIDIVRLFRSQIEAVQKATWQNSSEELSLSILGFKLSTIYKKDWLAIKNLIQFRNILAHGGLIVGKVDMVSTDKIFGPETKETAEKFLTKESLFNYLFSKNLVESTDNWGPFISWTFINSKIVDFFHLHTKAFLIKLYSEYQKKNRLHPFLENDIIAINRL